MDSRAVKNSIRLQINDNKSTLLCTVAVSIILTIVLAVIYFTSEDGMTMEKAVAMVSIIGCFLVGLCVALMAFLSGIIQFSHGFTSTVKFGVGRKSYLFGTVAYFIVLFSIGGEALWLVASLCARFLPVSQDFVTNEDGISAFLALGNWWAVPLGGLVIVLLIVIFGAIILRFGMKGLGILYFGGLIAGFILPNVFRKFIAAIPFDLTVPLIILGGAALIGAFIWSLRSYMWTEVS